MQCHGNGHEGASPNNLFDRSNVERLSAGGVHSIVSECSPRQTELKLRDAVVILVKVIWSGIGISVDSMSYGHLLAGLVVRLDVGSFADGLHLMSPSCFRNGVRQLPALLGQEIAQRGDGAGRVGVWCRTLP